MTIKFVDDFLNKITMYRIVLYVLVFFFGGALLLSVFGLLPFTPVDLFVSLAVILSISYLTNIIFAYIYKAPANTESVYITAFILFFIITPVQSGVYSVFIPLALFTSIWAVASKYIFAIGKKHIFNPAAFAVFLASLTINESASWWIGTASMLPFVFIGGLLIVRKIRRADLIISFLASSFITIIILSLIKGSDTISVLLNTVKNSAFFFFAFVMLTEPLTAPTTRWLRILFGILVGFLFAPDLHIGSIFSTPELALILGNVFAYIVSPKDKLILKLKDKIRLSRDTFDFIFQKDKNFSFKPGQYMEWTLRHRSPDARGNRRYFTLASSPTENEIHLGVKFYPEPSSFKNRLLALPVGEEIVVAQKSGDFVLPKESEKGLVFIAGGIGITPFRSMIKYLLDKGEKRQITLLYSNKKIEDIAYKEIFDQAESELGIKTVYAVTDERNISQDKSFRNGPISSEFIKNEIDNYTNKIFYISGPHGMVNAFEKTLKSLGVSSKNIKIDFFPGFV